jgi:hypothetical protein
MPCSDPVRKSLHSPQIGQQRVPFGYPSSVTRCILQRFNRVNSILLLNIPTRGRLRESRPRFDFRIFKYDWLPRLFLSRWGWNPGLPLSIVRLRACSKYCVSPTGTSSTGPMTLRLTRTTLDVGGPCAEAFQMVSQSRSRLRREPRVTRS